MQAEGSELRRDLEEVIGWGGGREGDERVEDGREQVRMK